MESSEEYRIVETKVLEGGIFVIFDNGENGYYPGYLIHAALGLARVLTEEELELP